MTTATRMGWCLTGPESARGSRSSTSRTAVSLCSCLLCLSPSADPSAALAKLDECRKMVLHSLRAFDKPFVGAEHIAAMPALETLFLYSFDSSSVPAAIGQSSSLKEVAFYILGAMYPKRIDNFSQGSIDSIAIINTDKFHPKMKVFQPMPGIKKLKIKCGGFSSEQDDILFAFPKLEGK